jgi:uncharacterized protein
MGEEGRLDLNQLLEDELLLALPVMPVHDEENCAGLSRFSCGQAEETGESPRKFADLASLLNKGSN